MTPRDLDIFGLFASCCSLAADLRKRAETPTKESAAVCVTVNNYFKCALYNMTDGTLQ
jgi:hypothetical protein